VALLSELGLVFDACVTHAQLPALTDLVARCDAVTFVLDHLGKPDVAGGRLDPWRADLARLAKLPNVACKLSGLATEADPRGWTPADLRPYLDHALACFGPQRCLVGSDWPVATLATTYDRWFDVVLDCLDDLGFEERRAVLSDNAVRVYGLAA
jgi:L-fuconolactonase